MKKKIVDCFLPHVSQTQPQNHAFVSSSMVCLLGNIKMGNLVSPLYFVLGGAKSVGLRTCLSVTHF